MSRHSAVDPRFGARLRQLRQQRGLSLRALAGIAHLGKSYLQELETGLKRPTPGTAQHLDRVLETGGDLARMVGPALNRLWTPDHEDRLAYVVRQPRRVDRATLESLNAVLAHQRRLEDSIGSAPLVVPVTAQAQVLVGLVESTPDDERRAALVDLAAQWAHFAGWLTSTTGDLAAGRTWYLRALDWATEAGNADLIATVLSMRGHQAWVQGRLPAMVQLSRAAGWQPAGVGVRALAIQQEGRGLAMMGDAAGSDSHLDRAADMAREAATRPDDQPPWLYFYDPDYFALQRGLAEMYLGRYQRAVETFTSNLQRLPAEIRGADWIGWYVLQLAVAQARSGNQDAALAALEEVRAIVEATAAERLAADVRRCAELLAL